MSLNLFPARVAIGRFADPNNKNKNTDVYCTPEFFRAMSELFNRVGGASGSNIDDLALLSLFSGAAEIAIEHGADGGMQMLNAPSGQDGGIASIERALADVQLLAASVASLTAEVQELRKSAASIEMATGYQDQFRVDWERPGKIGALTASTGAFTTLTASGAVTLSPANAVVSFAPTGTGTVTIAPAAAGTMDNVAIGGTTKAAGGFTTVSTTDNISLTRATGAPKITVTATTGTNETYLQFINTGGGYYFGVENSAGGWFGATAYAAVVSAPVGKVIQQMVGGTISTTASGTGMTVAGAFGCNTKAEQGAYASGGALAAYGAGANGLDTGANMSALHALVVSIRAALVANGIMS